MLDGITLYWLVNSEAPAAFPTCTATAAGTASGAGGGHRAELVEHLGGDRLAQAEPRKQVLRIDAAYREWARNRADIERLRRLQAVTGGDL